MPLDLATLSLVTVLVTALLGLLLLFSWWQNRSVRALAPWGASLILAAIGCGLLIGRAVLPGWLSIGGGNAILFAGCGLFWAGTRTFESRPAPAGAILAGAALWLAACGIPDFYKSFEARVALASLIPAIYAVGAAREIWRARAERLGSRYPLIVVLLLHAAFLLSRYPTVGRAGAAGDAMFFTMGWVVAHAFEALVLSITAAFLLLTMTKERAEQEQRTIASRDPLTGARNRRAFLAEARVLVDRARREGEPCALLLLDLDHFKRVNDRYGHGAGDDVLRAFCGAAAKALPGQALFARLGGEEFACLLKGVGEAGGLEVAEKVRATFAACRFEAAGYGFGATVSVGLATSEDVGHILDALLAAADLSLYGAKNAGRNRVVSLGDALLPAEVANDARMPIAA